MKEELFQKRVAGIEPFSMLDFGTNLCAILFYNGCNYHCGYCYNAELARGAAETLQSQDIIKFLEERRRKLDGIVFSGGECTIHKGKLIDDIRFTKSLGYAIKVDTNGSNPDVIQQLIDEGLINYVALDFKCPLNKWASFMPYAKYYNNFKNTFDLLQKSGVPFEVRTTVHTDILDEDDISTIVTLLEKWGYNGVYYIQFFFPAKETLGKVNPAIRHFDVDKIKSKHIKIEYRNKEGNP